MALPMLTASGVASALADQTGITKTDVRHVLDELKILILSELESAHRFKLVGLVQLEPKIRPARAERMGRNPATSEEIVIPAKPAEPVIRARVLAEAKNATPSLSKLASGLGVPNPGTKVPKPSKSLKTAPMKPKKKIKAKAKAKR